MVSLPMDNYDDLKASNSTGPMQLLFVADSFFFFLTAAVFVSFFIRTLEIEVLVEKATISPSRCTLRTKTKIGWLAPSAAALPMRPVSPPPPPPTRVSVIFTLAKYKYNIMIYIITTTTPLLALTCVSLRSLSLFEWKRLVDRKPFDQYSRWTRGWRFLGG